MQQIDKLDEELIRQIEGDPGSSIGSIIRPFLKRRCERALRDRINRLSILGLIRLDKHSSLRGRILCFPIEDGKIKVRHAGAHAEEA